MSYISLYYNTGSAKLVEYEKNGEKQKKYKIENGDDVRVALATEYGEELFTLGVKSWQDYRLTINPRSKSIIIAKSQSKAKAIHVRMKFS
jgi:hypothetical protein